MGLRRYHKRARTGQPERRHASALPDVHPHWTRREAEPFTRSEPPLSGGPASPGCGPVAESVVSPAATPVATPFPSTVAIARFAELQATAPVMSLVVPSLKTPSAAS